MLCDYVGRGFEWLVSGTGLSRNVEHRRSRYIPPAHGDKWPDKITPSDCEYLQFSVETQSLSRKSVLNKVNVLQIMMTAAWRAQDHCQNPWTRVGPWNADKHPKGTLSFEEARSLLNPAAAGGFNPRAFATGARVKIRLRPFGPEFRNGSRPNPIGLR
jgi:hypothetical protein